MVRTMFWEFLAKVIFTFRSPLSLWEVGLFVSFKYMHVISNINTSSHYDLVLLSYSVVLLSRISMCLILCPLILRYCA